MLKEWYHFESEYFNLEQIYIFQAKYKVEPISKNVIGNRVWELIKGLNLGERLNILLLEIFWCGSQL
jgi:hypothetical protein